MCSSAAESTARHDAGSTSRARQLAECDVRGLDLLGADDALAAALAHERRRAARRRAV